MVTLFCRLPCSFKLLELNVGIASGSKYRCVESEYKKRGFGFWIIKRKETKESIGFAGLVVRDELDQPDVGYAIQQEHAGNGYAEEATRGVLEYIRNFLNLPLICAITSPGNKASINVLTKCGFHFEKCAPVFEDNEELNIYKLVL